ncbi:MAG TPA: SRPBCC domain-containing protein [Vulgatibacter sp.]|nr:SRPBCC domain-containing protein [Vulgatibacter sp.]
MSFVDKTARGQSTTIEFEFDLPHPPRKVWRALTEPALLAEWLLPVVEMELAPGAALRFQAPPQPGWDGRVDGRILEVEPHRRLRYTWVVGDLDTTVTFTLEPTATGTRLSLVHEGFREDQKKNFGGARYGWRMMGGKLVEVLDEAA